MNHDPAWKVSLHARKRRGEPEPDRHVHIVTADMAHAWHERRERNGIWRRRAHRIHVGAIRDKRTRSAASEDADDPVAADTGSDDEAQLPQVVGHHLRGTHLLPRNFRVLVQVAPHCNPFSGRRVHVCGDAFGHSSALRVSG
ncbi:MAG: hypothetical protein IPL75_06370 [Acidobacteria bacterium]|nr:hypothetical protein [Acidobacteriota bacterium]